MPGACHRKADIQLLLWPTRAGESASYSYGPKLVEWSVELIVVGPVVFRNTYPTRRSHDSAEVFDVAGSAGLRRTFFHRMR